MNDQTFQVTPNDDVLYRQKKDNPIIVFDGLEPEDRAGAGVLIKLDSALRDALDWARQNTGQSAFEIKIPPLTLPTLHGWRVYTGTGWIYVQDHKATVAGVRFENPAQVQRFRAAIKQVLKLI